MIPPSNAAPFDVFLSHNSKNKPIVRELKDRLVERDLAVWFDEDELRPGIPWQQLLEDGIKRSRSAAVLVGSSGIGPWENEEMRAALMLAVDDKRPVIPVLLPNAEQPELPMFLRGRTWVDLRAGLSVEGLNSLIWGITGINPGAHTKHPSAPTSKDPVPDSGEAPRRPPPAAVTPAANTAPPTPTAPEGVTTASSVPVSPPPGLIEILPGFWHIQIQTAFAAGQMRLQIFPGGMFHGELAAPMGMSVVDGQWQANPFAGQIALRGQQSNGFQIIPYMAFVQVTHFDPQQIVGVTNAGEQVAWHRAG